MGTKLFRILGTFLGALDFITFMQSHEGVLSGGIMSRMEFNFITIVLAAVERRDRSKQIVGKGQLFKK